MHENTFLMGVCGVIGSVVITLIITIYLSNMHDGNLRNDRRIKATTEMTSKGYTALEISCVVWGRDVSCSLASKN